MQQHKGVTIKQVMKSRAQRGFLPGPVPLGYVLRFDGGIGSIEPDTEMAPFIIAAFKRASTGRESLRRTLAILTEQGLRSRTGKPLSVSALWTILTNPFYTGMIRYKEEMLPGSQPPLISQELYEKVRQRLHERQRRP